MEERAIPGVNGYFVTTSGDLLSTRRKYRDGTTKQKVGGIDESGYERTTVKNDFGKKVHIYTHKAVAKAFVPNPNGYTYVLHKDGNKLNNAADNLSWCSRSEYVNHYHTLVKSGVLEPRKFLHVD